MVARWPQVVQQLSNEKITLGMYLAEGRLLALQGDALEIGFPPEYALHQDVLAENANTRLIEKTCAAVFGRSLRVRLRRVSAEKTPAAPAAGAAVRENEDVVREFLERSRDEFDATIITDDE
ncbi:MAG: hypothetical protein NC924_09925 [Candidatus Omnitrophica bacterium]|nr:hypothetical protein [Candidatus Omnitrophota bacterium]